MTTTMVMTTTIIMIMMIATEMATEIDMIMPTKMAKNEKKNDKD